MAQASACPEEALRILEAKRARPAWLDEFYTRLVKYLVGKLEYKTLGFKEDLFGIQLRERSSVPKVDGSPFEILELGIGSGANFKFYANPNIHVTGVDPSHASAKFAEAAAAEVGLAQEQFTFVEAVGEGLPLEDESVDAALSTLVLCSVADLQQTVDEVFRVLKPGGAYYFMEHVGAARGSNLRWWQDTLNPVQKFLGDGCNLNREPIPALETAGFHPHTKTVILDGLFVLGPHMIGRGIKPEV